MSEYELVSLVIQFTNTSIQLILAYSSILFAFLVMSYLTAHKLNRVLATCVLVLFSLVCYLLIFQIYHVRNDLGHLLTYLLNQQLEGVKELPWFGHNAAWGARVVSVLHYLVMVGGYTACIGYFFYQRNRGTQQEAQP